MTLVRSITEDHHASTDTSTPDSSKAGDGRRMTTLEQLINDRMRMPGQEMSLDDVVDRAKRSGQKLGRSNLHKLTEEAPVSLTRATILGLAAGLGVTPLTVANAALESMGINPRPIEVTDSASTIQIDPSLSEQNRRQLLALIREMRDGNDNQPATTPPQPRAQGSPAEDEKTRGPREEGLGPVSDTVGGQHGSV